MLLIYSHFWLGEILKKYVIFLVSNCVRWKQNLGQWSLSGQPHLRLVTWSEISLSLISSYRKGSILWSCVYEWGRVIIDCFSCILDSSSQNPLLGLIGAGVCVFMCWGGGVLGRQLHNISTLCALVLNCEGVRLWKDSLGNSMLLVPVCSVRWNNRP